MLFLRIIKGNLEMWQWILLLSVMLPMTVKDFRTKRVNGYLCLITILAALSIRVYALREADIVILLDLLPGAFAFLLSVVSKEAIGKGDALVLLFIGSVMGFRMEMEVIVISFILSGIMSLILYVLKKVDKNTEIPFVPFLSVGIIAGGII